MQILKFVMDFVFFVLQKHRGVADPLEAVADEISDEAILLCLDEFMVKYYSCHIVASVYHTYHKKVASVYHIQLLCNFINILISFVMWLPIGD